MCLHRHAHTHAPTFTDTSGLQHLLGPRCPNSCRLRWDTSSATGHFKQRYGGNICCCLWEKMKLWVIPARGCAAGRVPNSAGVSKWWPAPKKKCRSHEVKRLVLLFSLAIDCTFPACARMCTRVYLKPASHCTDTYSLHHFPFETLNWHWNWLHKIAFSLPKQLELKGYLV